MSDSSMSTTAPDDDGINEQTAQDLRDRVGDLEGTMQYWKQRVQDLEAENDEQANRIGALENRVDDLRHELDDFVGPVGQTSGREKRLKDIRAMMKSVARGSDRTVKWSRADIEDQLLGKGWEPAQLPEPTMFNDDIHELAASEAGFGEEKKTTEARDGAHRDVWHLTFDPAALTDPAEPEGASSGKNGPGGGHTARSGGS